MLLIGNEGRYGCQFWSYLWDKYIGIGYMKPVIYG